MSDTHYHGEEISADTYATLRRHEFNLESFEERLQRIENTTATMKEKWRRGDEAMRDFIGHKKREPSRRLPSVSTDAKLSTSIDMALPASTDINIITSVDIHSGLVQILVCKSLHPVIDTPKVKLALFFMLRNERDCLFVLLEDKQNVSIYYIYKIMSVLEISDDFGVFWRYSEQAPKMTIELDHWSILERNNRSILTSVYRSTAKRAESPFGHSRLEAQVFTILQDYP
ncbi:hypothetical protein F2Q70_00003998 [Brassica cretica]|uniref:Uncharacterized protein n=1 Tax=Brassica cretica TaxID=69181 RepID=A0A8S9ISC4_BRACR|nr:hypothetical protein F2Q70_00003998 [Brassica cretica]